MRIRYRLLCSLVFLLLCRAAATACVDSVWLQIDPVKCNGLRNGKFKVTKVFGGDGPFYYSIDGQSFSTNPTFDHLWTGEYILLVRDAGACIKQFTVKVPEPMEMQVRLQTPDSSVVIGKPIVLQAIIAPETLVLETIEWMPHNLFPKQDTLRQKVAISESTEFNIRLVDKNGCEAQNKLVVQVNKPQLYVPNAIKIGSEKDAFITVYSGEGIKEVAAFRVFNRSGALLFERLHFPSNDPIRGWNGRFNGYTVSPGVYVWTATVELLDGSFFQMDGSVTVVE